MIFNKPSLLTHLEIWAPKYSEAHKVGGERVALLAKYKVDAGSPWLIVEFTKAKHLLGQRYCIKKAAAQSCTIDYDQKIPMYAVPMSKLENWTTVVEEKAIINSFGWN